MPKINIYLPDDLAERVRNANLSVSAVCQGALREELERMLVVEQLAAKEERIVVNVGGPYDTIVEKAFHGTWLLPPDEDETRGGSDAGAYWGVALTRRGRIAVYVAHCNENWPAKLTVYDSLDEAQEDGVPGEVLVAAAADLDEDFTIELDI